MISRSIPTLAVGQAAGEAPPRPRMLKALEIAGFKSFADRTRFEFPDGITVVVGPNGSGKSNIVDAMKWVLGSQSAKSLRGQEMSDVIFKGSATRSPAGAAEATIVFENADGNLPVDAPEVHVTRRVYRSGESEYLINQQAVRLKDVRDLIRGTGIGIDAYSLIEQGKVDRMLQANAKERRAIFEEAAGISRFKAKKLEAERRLARVQSNLTRLSDIVDEVGARLKSVRSQASKAEKYRQATERLKELRTLAAWTDWTHLRDEIATCETELSQAVRQQEELHSERDAMTAKRQAADMQLQAIADRAREYEDKRGVTTQRIASLAGRRDADQESVTELRGTVAKGLRRVRALKLHAGSAAEELKDADTRLETCQRELASVRKRAEGVHADRDRIQLEADEILQRREDLQQRHLTTVRRVADEQSSLQRIDAQISENERLVATLKKRVEVARESLTNAEQDASVRRSRVDELKATIKTSEAELSEADHEAEKHRHELEHRNQETASLRAQLEGVRQRYLVLEDLQRRQEGLSGGVRELLEQLDGSSGRYAESVDGIVADRVTADVEIAPMIDAALGATSQYLIADGSDLVEAIRTGELETAGRVGIIRVDLLPEPPTENRIRLEGLQGVIGRADQAITFAEDQTKLISYLLSTTWLVEDLDVAHQVRKLGGRGQRFVTRNGEVMDSEGTVVVGPAQAASGLVSRKSELVAASDQIDELNAEVSENDERLSELAQLVDSQTRELDRMEKTHRGLLTKFATAEADARHADERLRECRVNFEEVQQESNQTDSTLALARTDANRLTEQLRVGRQHIETLESESADIEETLSETQQALQSAISAVTTISVDVARVEQKHESLAAAIEQQRRDQSQREEAVADAKAGADTGKVRLAELGQRIVATAAELVTAEEEQVANNEKLSALAAEADAVRESNRETIQASEDAIKKASEANERVHSVTSRRDSSRHRLTTLVERMLEDYQIDLHHDEPPEVLEPIEDRGAMDAEINRLRDQVQRTSNVNMEALAELEGLQERFDLLDGQYQDLSAAKESLHRIIGRINADSRRLFMDTLEAIRQNFQRLYRKSFGGGHADLVLEEGEDPLEAGVEILATPPGKPSFSNSLLSGGEKALTAVALLMSIFQYRPSPFCVLDEVDAPFDEANIGRFVTVLNEFLDQSKFVVVTHSKKTMTAATTLYGVTMQESGVSKRVSIRFEDVSDDGEISDEAAA
ncbi:MAG: chromosome segregation protein SMC [Planctomycetota bacterium]